MNAQRLLIIEDDPDIRALLSEFLTREGYEVTALDNGRFAIPTIDSFSPHLVVLDLLVRGAKIGFGLASGSEATVSGNISPAAKRV